MEAGVVTLRNGPKLLFFTRWRTFVQAHPRVARICSNILRWTREFQEVELRGNQEKCCNGSSMGTHAFSRENVNGIRVAAVVAIRCRVELNSRLMIGPSR